MNIGEGLRIAALAKQGSAGIYMFGDPEPKQKKKFSYKSRKQKFALRRPETELENVQDENDENLPVEKKKPAVDFIKRNAAAVKKKGVQGKAKAVRKPSSAKSGTDSDTVTLTHKQLNALLAAIGNNIVTESEMIKSDEHGIGNEAIQTEGLTKQDSRNENSQADTEAVTAGMTEKSPATPDESDRNEKVNKQIAVQNSYSSGMGNVSGVIGTTGYNDKSLAEKKRLQWRQELDEQYRES